MPDRIQNLIDQFGRVFDPNTFLAAALQMYGDKALVVHKFGFNPAIVDALETIWDSGGLYPWQTSASIVSLVSTSADDAFGGAGAQTIKLYGLDADWNMQDEVVELDGLTPVTTTKEYLRLFRMTIPPLDSGPGQSDAQGTITASQGGTTRAQIINGNNQTLMAIYSIPAGYTGLLVHGSTGVGSGKEATVKYFVRPLNGVFNLGYLVQLFENNEQRPFIIPQRVNEKTDIDLRAISTAAGTSIGANFDLLLIKNPEPLP